MFEGGPSAEHLLAAFRRQWHAEQRHQQQTSI